MIPPRPGNYADRFGFSAEERALWRWIRDQGGYWCAAELAPHTSLASGARIAGTLKRLCTAGHLHRKHTPSWLGHAYGVTGSCCAPKGESMVPANTAEERAA